ncbi:MAG TPA: HAD family hydrolase [Gaiellaceae bacterium]|nr:HAD family hydrolase [Gaiellaceae bacterium]
MTIRVELPGAGALALEHLVLDLNGTLTDRGRLLDGVAARLAELARRLDVHLLSSDTFGTLGAVADALGVEATAAATGADKVRVLERLGAERCAAIGNGANDAGMLAAAALGIAVVGPEGAAGSALRAADVVCRSILEALDLLRDERALVATLRA